MSIFSGNFAFNQLASISAVERSNSGFVNIFLDNLFYVTIAHEIV